MEIDSIIIFCKSQVSLITIHNDIEMDNHEHAFEVCTVKLES